MARRHSRAARRPGAHVRDRGRDTGDARLAAGRGLRDIWNPSVPLLPLLLLIFVAWSLGCGEYRLLPLAVLLASFAVATHLSFLGPAVGLTLVGVACAVAFGSAPPAGPAGGSSPPWSAGWSAGAPRSSTRRSTGRAGQPRDARQIGGPQGRLGRLQRRVEGGRPHGRHPALVAAGRPLPTLARLGDLTVRPGALSIVSALLVVAALAALAVLGWRQRRADLGAAGLLGLTLCVAVGLATSGTPKLPR